MTAGELLEAIQKRITVKSAGYIYISSSRLYHFAIQFYSGKIIKFPVTEEALSNAGSDTLVEGAMDQIYERLSLSQPMETQVTIWINR